MTIILVRHAEPAATSDQAAHLWPLSDAGRRAAERLRSTLPQAGVWVSSTEVKAHETLTCARDDGRAIPRDAGFDEVRRDEPYDDDYRSRVTTGTAWRSRTSSRSVRNC